MVCAVELFHKPMVSPAYLIFDPVCLKNMQQQLMKSPSCTISNKGVHL
jgi:hypothetical protein